MYHAYWGLADSPFRTHANPRVFHEGGTQEEALARLHFLVDDHRALGLLLGDAGSGKSLILDAFSRRLGRAGRQTALVHAASIDLHEFLWQLSARLGVEQTPRASELALLRALSDHIAANRFQHFTTVLLLDDADLAHADVTDYLHRLVEMDSVHQGRLTLAMSARPDRLRRLDRRLIERVELRIDLDPWEADDTSQFIKRSLAEAGRTTPIFSDPALARLHELAGGMPRRIKHLADLALLAGAGGNLVQIEQDTIDAVYHELRVASPSFELHGTPTA